MLIDNRNMSRHLAQTAHRTGVLALFRHAGCAADRLGRWLHADGFWRRGGLVFMFHRIREQPDPLRPGLDLRLFEQFCELLAENYAVLPLTELEQRRARGLDVSRHVALTFDDGYVDNYLLALPRLQRYGLPATLFLTTGAVGGTHPLWTSRVSWIIEQGVAERAPHEFVDLSLRLEGPQQRAETALELIQRLRLFDPSRRNDLLDELADRLGVTDFAGLKAETVTWPQLREMDRAGFSAQPHTVTHPILSLLPAAQIEREIAESKETIEAQLGRPADLFAYPRGTAEDFDERAIQAVRRLAFRAAYTTEFAAIYPSDHPFRLPRVCLYARSLPEMRLQVERFFYLHPKYPRNKRPQPI